MEPNNLLPAIAQQALEPISTTADGQSNVGRTTADMMLAVQFLAAACAAKLPHQGLRRRRILPPAQVDGHCGPCCGGGYPGPGGFG